MNLRTRLGGDGNATVTYTMSNRRGSISGSANVTLSYGGSNVSYKGVASITKGTGSYRRVCARAPCTSPAGRPDGRERHPEPHRSALLLTTTRRRAIGRL